MLLSDDLFNHAWELLRDFPLDEERAAYTRLVEKCEDEIDVADDPLRDWRLDVNTRLIPVLNIDGE
ncbi:MAG: hypothetical protein ACREUZ_20405, partial [Burkholderiales bacterium]